MPAEYGPRGLSRYGDPATPDGAAAREQARSREMQGQGLPPPYRAPPMGGSPLQQGLQGGSPLGGVNLRNGGNPRGPQGFSDGQSRDIMRTIDQRAGKDRANIDDLGHRALDGMVGVDRDNLRLNHDSKTGTMSIDRKFATPNGGSSWERVWNGGAPTAASKDPSAGLANVTQDAGNALAKSYRDQPYSNERPLGDDAFYHGAKDAISGKPANYREWGLPPGNRRS